jgi:hypothetical protein
MHWLGSNYQWLMTIVVMLIILLLLKQWVGSRKSTSNPAPTPPATLNAQDPEVSNSPVAAGSGINQSVSAPVVHVNIGQPAGTAQAPAQPGRVAQAPFQRPPRANIAFCGTDTIVIQEALSGGGGLFFQHDNGNSAAVVQFSNHAIKGAENKEAVVKAAIIYRDGTRELLRVTGSWLGQDRADVRFQVDSSHMLIIGFILGDDFCVLEKNQVFGHRRQFWVNDLHRLGKPERLTALVRLTEATSGYCFFEGALEVTTNPLKISNPLRP